MLNLKVACLDCAAAWWRRGHQAAAQARQIVLRYCVSQPLGYHISWTTKGTWLPGDERGWVERETPGIQRPDVNRWERAHARMHHQPVILNPQQRAVVFQVIVNHCGIREWTPHAIHVRKSHVHVVVTAPGVTPERVMSQLKSWCSRRLNEQFNGVTKWWTDHGSTKWINDEQYLRRAIMYVIDEQ